MQQTRIKEVCTIGFHFVHVLVIYCVFWPCNPWFGFLFFKSNDVHRLLLLFFGSFLFFCFCFCFNFAFRHLSIIFETRKLKFCIYPIKFRFYIMSKSIYLIKLTSSDTPSSKCVLQSPLHEFELDENDSTIVPF